MSKTASASFSKNALNLEAFSNLILALEKKDKKLFSLSLDINRPSYWVENKANKVPVLDEKLANSKFFRDNFDTLAAATDKIFPNLYDRLLSHVSYKLHNNSPLNARIRELRMEKMRDPGKDPVSVFTTYLKTAFPDSKSFYSAIYDNNLNRLPADEARSRIARIKKGPEFLQATQYFADTFARLADKKPAKAARFIIDYFDANDYDLDGRNHHNLMPSNAWHFIVELSLPHIMPVIKHLAKHNKDLAQTFIRFCMMTLPVPEGKTLRSDIVAYLLKKQATGKEIFDADELVKITAHHYRQIHQENTQTPEQARIADSIREMIKPLNNTEKLSVYAAFRKEVGAFRDPFAQEYEESLTNLSASDVVEYLYKAKLYSNDEMLSALDRCAQEEPEKLQKLLVEFIKYKDVHIDGNFNRSRLIEWVGTYVLDPSIEMDDKTRSILSYASHSLSQDDSDQKVALINMYLASEARLYDAMRLEAPQTAEDMAARLDKLENGKGKGKSLAPEMDTKPA